MSFMLQERIASIIEAQRQLSAMKVASIILDCLHEEASYDNIVREALAATHDFHRAAKAKYPKMVRAEVETLHLLLTKDFVSYEAILLLTRTKAYDNIVRVWVSRLRKQLKVEIQNHYHNGYSMKLEERQRLIKEINA